MEAFEKWSVADDGSGSGAGIGEPVLLSWTDHSSGEELWVEMWGSGTFVQELLGLGFARRTPAALGSDRMRRVIIRQSSA
jgi:hypothetical protein